MRSARSLESPIGPLALALAGAMSAIAVVRGIFDPDYFWHAATGRQILTTGRIPTTEPFSFTWFGQPWVPDQWLAEVIMAGLNQTVGVVVTIVVFAVGAIAGPVLVAEASRRSGAPFHLVAPMLVLVSAAILPQVTARPQALGLMFVGAVLAILIRARAQSLRWVLVLPPMFLLWANLHGSFVIGLAIGGVYLVATLLGHTPMSSQKRLTVAIAGMSLVATALTPSGPAGVAYALSFADSGDFGARQILEWQSPSFHDVQFLPFVGLLAALLLADIRRAPCWMVVVAIAGAASGLYALRGIGIGAIMIMPAVLIANVGPSAIPAPRTSQLARRAIEWTAASVVVAVVLTAAVTRGPVQADSRRLPVRGTDALSERLPDARVLTKYEWGGYVIDRLYQRGVRVFVDGRMHKYAPDVLADYLAIIEATPRWQALIDKYGVQAILVSPDTPVAKGPAQDDGWCEAYRDRLQVLLLRDCRQG